jgi:hypothetical protein
LFQETKWRGGVWKQALGRTEIDWAVTEGEQIRRGAIGAIDGVKVKFDRISANAVLVPLCAVIDAEELPGASNAEDVAAWIDKQTADGA